MVNIWLIYGYCMVIVWLMMVNNNLIGGIPIPLKNDGVTVGMIIPFPTEGNNKNVPNHQPVMASYGFFEFQATIFVKVKVSTSPLLTCT